MTVENFWLIKQSLCDCNHEGTQRSFLRFLSMASGASFTALVVSDFPGLHFPDEYKQRRFQLTCTTIVIDLDNEHHRKYKNYDHPNYSGS